MHHKGRTESTFLEMEYLKQRQTTESMIKSRAEAITETTFEKGLVQLLSLLHIPDDGMGMKRRDEWSDSTKFY
jgi:hypothetical protein